MAKMAARYGHFGIEELCGAVEAIGYAMSRKGSFEAGSLEFSLELRAGKSDDRAN
jgi:hypothetical protein